MSVMLFDTSSSHHSILVSVREATYLCMVNFVLCVVGCVALFRFTSFSAISPHNHNNNTIPVIHIIVIIKNCLRQNKVHFFSNKASHMQLKYSPTFIKTPINPVVGFDRAMLCTFNHMRCERFSLCRLFGQLRLRSLKP